MSWRNLRWKLVMMASDVTIYLWELDTQEARASFCWRVEVNECIPLQSSCLVFSSYFGNDVGQNIFYRPFTKHCTINKDMSHYLAHEVLDGWRNLWTGSVHTFLYKIPLCLHTIVARFDEICRKAQGRRKLWQRFFNNEGGCFGPRRIQLVLKERIKVQKSGQGYNYVRIHLR